MGLKKINGGKMGWLIPVILMIFIYGCSPNPLSPEKNISQQRGRAEKESAMKTHYRSAAVSPAIPAIDAAVPTHTETATFGLG